MMTTERARRTLAQTTAADQVLRTAIRVYVGAYVQRDGQQHAAHAFGVSRTTLWRCLARGHLGRALPRAVLAPVGGSVAALTAATRALAPRVAVRTPALARPPLSDGLEDTLLLLCATPLTTLRELSCRGRVPASTLRDRLAMLTQRGLVDAVSHRLGLLGPHPQRRYFPTPAGVTAASAATTDPAAFLHAYPLSRQWFRLLAARLDAVAVLYRVAAVVATADPSGHPVRVDYCRQGPYDVRLTLSGGRTLGLLRHGPLLPTAPDAALADIVAWTEHLLAGPPASHCPTPTPDPAALYPADVRATLPESVRQLTSALAVQLTRADKATLDLLAAWPCCTRQQLAGLLGGVTRHRAGQALRSLLRRALVRADGPRYVLTDDALKYLAHRDRAAVGPTLAQ